MRLVGNDHRVGVEAFGLLDEQLYVVVGRECIYFKQVGVFGHDVKRLCTYRACGT